jgi:hypothetical protein
MRSRENLPGDCALSPVYNVFRLNVFSQTSLATKMAVDRLNERQDGREYREERQAILEWLTTIDYAPQQSDFINRREAGTGRWLIDSEEYQTWVQTPKKTLFCPGIPGAGKTILTSIVIDHLSTKFLTNQNVGIAYLYCNFRGCPGGQKQTAENLLASLLKQLIQGQPSIPDEVETLYNRHKDKGTGLSFDEISRTLQSVAVICSQVFIVIDALDECQAANGCRTKFLTEIFNLQAKSEIHLFATSRFIPEITEKFRGSISLEIRASNDDIGRYLEANMEHNLAFKWSQELQNEIKVRISEAVDGMYVTR